ncbi:flavin-containing monooxygenase [Gordonia araii NBRC 100433]|uniref:Flavin-containing monooxygenase n=1 Tax=Gordonia araii NBRC 100433 TaxID=1073574 RepID=G7H2L5_9ACTN|nr:DUF4873 domain-containing protein [Gordonia araii]NNG97746.1 DUF4873 domain-containing protein [Gordonia araii NBRC 100433]GAB10090.1 flavin-containing monooxygenase [Gordonia araii NBRC 100433]
MSSVFSHSPHEGSDYIGDATIIVRGTEVPAQVELRGYREPIDGVYRWIGRVTANEQLSEILGDAQRTKVIVKTEHSAQPAFIGDPDPWNRYRIISKSTPPYHVATDLAEVESQD